MRANVVVESEEEFEQWLDEQEQAQAPAAGAESEAGA
jgi:heme/copper-type cytochrome/quinol oxidase subunit 2